MKTKDKFFYICSIIVLVLFLIPIKKTYAAVQVHDYISNDTYPYTGTTVNYIVNGQTVSSDRPGLILSDGSAIGSFQDIFRPLGITTTYTDGSNTFTLTYQSTTIQMTLGNTTAVVNGKTQIMAQAPTVLSLNGQTTKYLYVPTRFVAETFGFSYQWNAASATSTIIRPKSVYDGTTPVSYTGIHPAFFVNGTQVSDPDYPSYIFDDTVLLPLTRDIAASGLCNYDYRSEERLILLKKDDTIIRFVVDSPIAYVGEKAYVLSSVPRIITPYGLNTSELYLPAEFTLNALGYQVTADKSTQDIKVTGKTLSSDTDFIVPADSAQELDPASYQKELFSYTAHTQLISYYKEKGYHVPTRISAYSCKNSDAIYFQGITKEQLTVTDKYDLFEIKVAGSFNPYGTSLYYEPDNQFLNYFGIKNQKELTITLLKSSDFVFYSYNLDNGCVVQFCSAENKNKDKLLIKKSPEMSAGTGKITLPQSTKELLPAVIGDKKAFTILLPESITIKDIIEEDDYNNLRFILKIPGNYAAVLSEQEIYNPVTTLKNYTFRYNATENMTYMTFNTTKIQGYKYTLNHNVLSIQIDDPKKVYDKIIVLDAGHGGIDPGTLRGSVYEKNINFNVLNLYAASYFKDSDIKVYYTRTTDTKIALETRAALPAKVGADFFISFHVNSNNNPIASGTSVYYSASNNTPNASGLTSRILGTAMLNKLTNAMGTKNAGLLTQKFVVIHENTVPAILIEIGFITNDNDFAKLNNPTYQKTAAKAIFDVVNEIFDNYPTNR